jgi:hypothetical protein
MALTRVICESCEEEHIYACIGTQEFYLCKKCFDLYQAGEITFETLEAKRVSIRKAAVSK